MSPEDAVLAAAGAVLARRGEITVGEIVSFMGFATMLIGRMDQASGFVSRIFFQMPSLGDFFRVLDSQSSVPDKPNGIDIGRARGDVEFDDINGNTGDDTASGGLGDDWVRG